MQVEGANVPVGAHASFCPAFFVASCVRTFSQKMSRETSMRFRTKFGLAAGLLLGLTCSSLANDLVAVAQFSGTTIMLRPQQNYANLTLRVTGPDEYEAGAAFPNGTPVLDLSRYGKVVDGLYDYHLVGTTGEAIVAARRDNGRSAKNASEFVLRTVSKGGSFTVRGGAIVSNTDVEPQRSK
jgi:hypothetical protein